jgi:hypothetical protein
LAALLLLAFSPWLLGGKVCAPSDILTEMMLPWRGETTVPAVHNHYVTDAVTQYIPYRIFAERSFCEDGYIGWNPNVLGGAAQYGNTMGLYFDWTMQLHRWLPFWTAWNLGLLLQFAVAGWGMLMFLRAIGCVPAIALLGAAAFLANSQFVVWIYHRWALSSFCWFPWIALGLWHWSRQKSLRWLAASAIFLALGFAGGSLQHAAILVVGVIAMWLGTALDRLRSSTCLQSQLRLLGGFACAGLLAMALSGWMWQATVASYFENSAAGHERASFGYAGGLLQPALHLASYPLNLFASLAGSPQNLDLFKLFKSDVFNAAFVGTLPALLAVSAIFSTRVPTAPKFLIAAGLILPLTPLVGIFYHRINILALIRW